jgi:hypothetical protein
MSPQKNEGVCSCLIYTFKLIMSLFIMFGIIIVSLIWLYSINNGHNLKINEKCPNSNLLVYMIIFGIFTVISIIYMIKSNIHNIGEDLSKICCRPPYLLILLLTHVIMCWCGRFEIENDNWCIQSNYTHSAFWITSFYMWWGYFIALCLIGVIFASLIIGGCMYQLWSSFRCSSIEPKISCIV